MKKMVLFGMVALILLQIAYAVNVGLVVDFPSGTITTECVRVEDGATGKDALEASSFSVQYIYGGAFVDGINDIVSDNVNYLYWSVWQSNADHFELTAVGITDLTMDKDGIILGFAYGGFDSTFAPVNTPTFIPYEDVCPNMLKIEEVTAYVDGDKDTLSQGEKIKNVKPQSRLKLKVTAKNLYEDPIEINNIIIKAVIKDIDDGDDLEEESDEFDLDAGDDETETIEFDIPLEVEDDNYDLLLSIEGKDNRGIEYTKKLTYLIDVKKEKHDVQIRSMELSDSEIKCRRNTQLSIGLLNLGKEEEDVTLKLSSPEIEFSKQETFTLSEDPFDSESRFRNTYQIKVPEDTVPDVYAIVAEAIYNEGSDRAKKSVDLVVEECEGQVTLEQQPSTKQQNTQQAQEPAMEQQNIQQAPTITSHATQKETFLSQETALFLTVSMAIIIGIGIIMFIVLFMFKR